MLNIKNINSSITITIISHLIIWLLLLQLIYDFSGLWESLNYLLSSGTKYMDEAFILIPSIIGLFYWNTNFLIPNFLNVKYWWKYLIVLIISFIVVMATDCFLFQYAQENGYESGVDDLIGFFDFSLMQHLIIIGISTSLGVSKIAMKNANQKKQAIEKQRQTELKYLNSQFNPHFLFNTLNTIYSLSIEEDAPKTTDATLKLSEIMRYSLKQSEKEKIALSEEIQFIEEYINLIQLRVGKDYPITFKKNGQFKGLVITPLLLISIVENAFKYGITQSEKSPIIFSILVQNNSIIFTSENKIKPQKNNQSLKSGISNLKRRLDLIYGRNYFFEYIEIKGKFFVTLELKQGKSAKNKS